MKLALVFCIVGGLISCSLQYGRVGWVPNNFQQARLPYYYFADQGAELDQQFYGLPSNDVQKYPVGSPFFKSSNKNPQSRLFGFMLLNQLKNSLLSSLPTVTFTSTTTSVSTSVSTITTIALQNCISSAGFAPVDPANAAGALKTTACSRKKRLIELDALEPSKVIPMETSRISRSDDNQNLDPYVLSSSFLDLQEDSDVGRQVGIFRAFPSILPKSTSVVTVISTSTSFSFVASTVKKAFTLAADAALTCLPTGFVVC